MSKLLYWDSVPGLQQSISQPSTSCVCVLYYYLGQYVVRPGVDRPCCCVLCILWLTDNDCHSLVWICPCLPVSCCLSSLGHPGLGGEVYRDTAWCQPWLQLGPVTHFLPVLSPLSGSTQHTGTVNLQPPPPPSQLHPLYSAVQNN